MVKGQTKMFLLKTGQMTKSSLAQSMLYEHFTSYSTYVNHSYYECAASSAIFWMKLNGKQAQRARGIKFELAIIQQRTTLSKLSNGTDSNEHKVRIWTSLAQSMH